MALKNGAKCGERKEKEKGEQLEKKGKIKKKREGN